MEEYKRNVRIIELERKNKIIKELKGKIEMQDKIIKLMEEVAELRKGSYIEVWGSSPIEDSFTSWRTWVEGRF